MLNTKRSISDFLELLQATAKNCDAALRSNTSPEDFHFHSSKRIQGGTTLDAFVYVAKKGVVVELTRTTAKGRRWIYEITFDENVDLAQNTKDDFENRLKNEIYWVWNVKDIHRIAFLLINLKMKKRTSYVVKIVCHNNIDACSWIGENRIPCKAAFDPYTIGSRAVLHFRFQNITDAVQFRMLCDGEVLSEQ